MVNPIYQVNDSLGRSGNRLSVVAIHTVVMLKVRRTDIPEYGLCHHRTVVFIGLASLSKHKSLESE